MNRKKKDSLRYEYETFINRGHGRLSQEWQDLLIMQGLNLSYQEYLDTPQYIVDLYLIQREIEAKEKK